MSSDTLTPPPSSSSPFRPVETAHAPARKRPSTGASKSHSPRKRVRSGTPVLSLYESELAEGNEASALDYNTTVAGPSSRIPLQRRSNGTGGDAELECSQSNDMVQAMAGGQTSETGDGADSVLFSEHNLQSAKSGMSTSTVVKGNLRDYIPQPDETVIVPHTEATEDLGEYINDDDDVEEEEVVVPAVGDADLPEKGGCEDDEDMEDQEEEPDEMEESHDRNDEEEEEGDPGDDAAATPAWLTEQYSLVPEPVDQMTRILEEKNKRTASREGPSRPTSTRVAGNSTRSDQELGVAEKGDEEDDEDIPTSPGSYHSGDTDQYDMYHRPILERTAIKHDIKRFVNNLSCLVDEETGDMVYRVVDRLGEGKSSIPAEIASCSSPRHLLFRLPRARRLLSLLQQLLLDRDNRQSITTEDCQGQDRYPRRAQEDLGDEQPGKDRKRTAYPRELAVGVL